MTTVANSTSIAYTTRRKIRCPGLTNFSGIRRTSTNAASGLDVRLSSAASRRRNLALATLARHDWVAVWAGPHGHNALMAGHRRAARLGAMLLGTGTAHFVAPKSFEVMWRAAD